MTKTKAPEPFEGVKAKFAARKAEGQKARQVELPLSGVKATIPGMINHGLWMQAQRQAGGDVPTAQAAFVAQVVRFEGEQLTLADLRELVDARDIMFLIAQIFGDGGDDDGAGEAGNAVH